MFVGGETILPQGETTQGDPLAMAMYALALVPMIAGFGDTVMKDVNLPVARAIFEDTGIQFTTHGRQYLGAAIGSADFVQLLVNDKVREWSDKLFRLSGIGFTQPHAAYSALTHGLLGRWTFLSRTKHVWNK